jgi:2-dehydropantoate 2-reductase
MRMRIAMFGAGGTGGYFGARLARAGEHVILIARGEHLRAIRENGLRVDSTDGDFVVTPALVTDDPAKAGAVDVVFVCVKAWQVPEVAQAIRPLIGPETFVVPLQNGVEAADQLTSALGRERVVGGSARVLTFIAAPGCIRHLGGPASITVGELDHRPSERTERLREFLSRGGIAAEISPDIHVSVWEKFLFIAPLGGIGAVTRAPVGTLRTLPETRRMLEEGMREIRAVAQERKVVLRDDIVARTMDFVDSLPPEGTVSMQRDIIAGCPSELEAWNGAVVRLGQQAGVATPLHDYLYRSLLPLELRARGKVQFPA